MPLTSTFELVTRAGCHLCDEMEAVLLSVLPRHGMALGYRDVDAEPELLERFSDVVPVLLRDGAPVAKIRLSEASLERLIRRRR
jgi:hypothetical protein